MTMRHKFVLVAILTPLVLLAVGRLWPPIHWAFVVIGPIIALGLYDMFQTSHTLRRLYPCLLYTSPSPRD